MVSYNGLFSSCVFSLFAYYTHDSLPIHNNDQNKMLTDGQGMKKWGKKLTFMTHLHLNSPFVACTNKAEGKKTFYSCY